MLAVQGSVQLEAFRHHANGQRADTEDRLQPSVIRQCTHGRLSLCVPHADLHLSDRCDLVQLLLPSALLAVPRQLLSVDSVDRAVHVVLRQSVGRHRVHGIKNAGRKAVDAQSPPLSRGCM